MKIVYELSERHAVEMRKGLRNLLTNCGKYISDDQYDAISDFYDYFLDELRASGALERNG